MTEELNSQQIEILQKCRMVVDGIYVITSRDTTYPMFSVDTLLRQANLLDEVQCSDNEDCAAFMLSPKGEALKALLS